MVNRADNMVATNNFRQAMKLLHWLAFLSLGTRIIY